MRLSLTAPRRLLGARVAARSLLRITLLGGTLLLAAALAGCGKSLPSERQNREAGVTRVESAGMLAASGLATKNTTRLGGADVLADAATVALAVHPGLTPATRPRAVVLVDRHDWPAALACAALSSAPLGAPLLYTEGNTLPSISAEALAALHPRGTSLLHGAQVIEVGTSAAPAGYRVHALPSTTAAGLAARVEQLLALARGAPPRHVIVIGVDGPPALAMPAAGLAAESASPILPVTAHGIPGATRRTLLALRRPTIYVVGGPAGVNDTTLAKLRRYGTVRRVAVESAPPLEGGAEPGATTTSTAPGATSGTATATTAPPVTAASTDAVTNSIAVARFSDGSFGWGVEEPGHGLVFASATRPLDAPAAASLSASGDFGPLLLLEGPTGVPDTLAHYLSDIQPSYPEYQPTRGFYNHGWLIGDETAIAAATQAELDTMLETLPRSGREQ